jgi:hypothetical protein
VTNTTFCCFGAIDRAALLTDLDHRAVLRCGRFPRAKARRMGVILVFLRAGEANGTSGMLLIVHLPDLESGNLPKP